MGRKWNNIKEKKAQKDKNTSRIYAKFGKRNICSDQIW